MAALCNSAGHYILPRSLYLFLSFYLFPRLISAVGDWMSTILPHYVVRGLSANLGCRSETCCTLLAEIHDAKNRHLSTIVTTLSGYILATKAHIDNRKKDLLSSNISSRRLHNVVNFGPLAAEIGPIVWSTPANFNVFRVLAALLHGTPAVGVSQTLRR